MKFRVRSPLLSRKRLASGAAIALWMSLACVLGTSSSDASPEVGRVLLLLDGVSPEAFLAAKGRGAFQRFVSTSSHVAPFPAISDYSWSQVLGGTRALGAPGRIRHYEAAYFDEGRQRAEEDGRFYFHRVANPLSAYAAVDTLLNPFIEGLAYFPTTKLRTLELAQVESDLLTKENGPVAVALLSIPDAIAHTRPTQLQSYLEQIDAMIERVVENAASAGKVLRIDLVADHGQTNATNPAGEIVPLYPVDLDAMAAKAGLTKRDQLTDASDVVFPVLALASYVGGWTQTPAAARAFVDATRGEDFFDLAILREPPRRSGVTVRIVGRSSEALLDVTGGGNEVTLRYTPVGGDPLDVSTSQHHRWLSLDAARSAANAGRPDALVRIARAALEEDAALPDVLLSFADGYRVMGSLEGLTTMWQSHGSLSASSSLGILASTDPRPLPPRVLSHQILDVLKLRPNDLYPATGLLGPVSSAGRRRESVVSTGANDLSSRALFRRMARVSDLSSEVFDEDTAEVFLKALPEKGLGFGSSPATPLNLDTDWRTLVTADEIAEAIDAVVDTDDVEALSSNPRLRALPKRVLQRLNKGSSTTTATAPPNALADTAGNAEPHENTAPRENAPPDETGDNDALPIDLHHTAAAGRVALMRVHGIRALLDDALTVAEHSAIIDPRDHAFVAEWQSRRHLAKFAAPLDHKAAQVAQLQKLFRAIHTERMLAGDVFPAALTVDFPLDAASTQQATVVYFSGIYDEVFDGKIFREGLRTLGDLGVRVLEAPVHGACSPVVNAERTFEFLRQDARQRAARGRTETPYVFLGYSKGAVDALQLMATHPEWTREHVVSMVTLGAPLQGAGVLARRDLGAEEFALLTGAPPPSDCRDENAAGSNVTGPAMNAFFEAHSPTLVDSTRFFSLSFRSTLKDAHLWMKLTKNIAGFHEDNDGVVALSASRFPAQFDATDLGVLEADHLAGLVTSPHRFDQRALFSALWLFLQESGALQPSVTRSFVDRARAHSPWTTVPARVLHLQEILGRVGVTLDDTGMPLASRIERALAGTPYEVGPFDLQTSDGHRVAVTVRPASFAGFRYTERGPPVVVDTAEQLALALLGPLRDDGRDLATLPKERWRTFPTSSRPPFVLPPNNLAFDVKQRINLRNIGTLLEGKFVTPLTVERAPEGIPLVFDRPQVSTFRNEFEFYWEDLSPPAADENLAGGWAADVDANGRLMARLHSTGTSARLTSFSMRFRPVDFPRITLEAAVEENVVGADVVRGGTGRDDSAFQLWFVLREIDDGADRSTFSPDENVRIFGYYWSAGDGHAPGSLVENTYSERDLVIVRLPEAYQLAIANDTLPPEDTRVIERSLTDDLAKAFPTVPVERFEVLAITFQHDSNDTQTQSKARFYRAEFTPRQGP